MRRVLVCLLAAAALIAAAGSRRRSTRPPLGVAAYMDDSGDNRQLVATTTTSTWAAASSGAASTRRASAVRSEVRLCVSVPVLKRPHRVAPLVASLEASLEDEDVEVAMVFVCSTDDAPQIAAVEAAGFEPLLSGQAFQDFQYAVKTNAAVRAVEADWYLLAADDLDFRPGWLREALKVHAETGALVVGTNDLGNDLVKRGKHSTHPFVHRDYLPLGTIDEDERAAPPGYRHNSVATSSSARRRCSAACGRSRSTRTSATCTRSGTRACRATRPTRRGSATRAPTAGC
jgi:hypothetical protein